MPNRETFEAAADAIVSGDIARLRQLLAEHPDLIHARSTRDHHSTLLHYVSANGVEDDRQKTPGNIVEITRLLLDTGAEVDAHSDAYGGGSTTLGLAATSIHPQKAGVQLDLLQTLLDHGASLQHNSAGNNHAIVLGCLANGQPEAANFLASKGAPLDVESAAFKRRPSTTFCGPGTTAAERIATKPQPCWPRPEPPSTPINGMRPCSKRSQTTLAWPRP